MASPMAAVKTAKSVAARNGINESGKAYGSLAQSQRMA